MKANQEPQEDGRNTQMIYNPNCPKPETAHGVAARHQAGAIEALLGPTVQAEIGIWGEI